MRRPALLGITAALAAMAAGSAAWAGRPDRPAAAEWSAAGGSWSNDRYSTLRQITPGNIGRLGGAWVRKLEGETSRSVPVVAHGRMFLTAGRHVYALNPKDGATLWTHEAPIPPSFQFKGVAVGGGLVFYGTADARIVALDAATGALRWSTPIGDEGVQRGEGEGIAALTLTGQYISAAPVFANGLVISGLSNGDFSIRGRVVALDARTGRQVWRFDTIPGPGEFGHDSWPQDGDLWQRGGGGSWSTPAVDGELGMVYFGVGNPVPQWGGELRPGDNLFTGSIVAVDLKTGKYRWHFQAVHHDIWDADLGTPVVLYDALVRGRPVKALAAMHTNGFLFLLDRRTGRPVHPVEEVPVPQNPRLFTHPTQPFPVGADMIAPRCLPRDAVPEGFEAKCLYDPIDFDMPNAMYPVMATRAAPLAYSPDTRYVYAAASIWPYWVQRFEDPRFFRGSGGAGVPGKKYSGILAAIDTRTNKIAWRREVPYEIQNGSGFTATRGGIAFHGQPDGAFQAYDAASGELLWQFQTGSPQNGPASVYEIDGEQYVAAVSDQAVWAFKLGGTVAPLPATPPPRTESAWSGRVANSDRVALSTRVQDSGLEKLREAVDEYAFEPQRTRVKRGAKLTFTNQGRQAHEIRAVDGSWSTGLLQPGQSAAIAMDRPGSFTYQCHEHKWSYGQVIVDP